MNPECLVKSGVDINLVVGQDIVMLKTIYDRGCIDKEAFRQSFSAIFGNRNPEMCDVLMESKVINVKDDKLFSEILQRACEGRSDSSNLIFIDRMLGHGVNPNGADGSGKPLLLAMQNHNLEVCKALIHYGATPVYTDPTTGRQESSLVVALKTSHSFDLGDDVVELIMEKSNLSDEQKKTLLNISIHNCDDFIFNKIIKLGVKLPDDLTFLTTSEKRNLISIAAMSENPSLLDQVLRAGIPIDVSDNGWTALGYILYSMSEDYTEDDLKVVERLIKAGANVKESVPKDRGTPLGLAVETENFLLCQMLVDAGATIGGLKTRSALWFYEEALMSNRLSMLENLPPKMAFVIFNSMLVSNNISKACTLLDKDQSLINYQDERGRTLLHCALQQENIEVAQVLLARGARDDVADNQGITPKALFEKLKLNLTFSVNANILNNPGAAMIKFPEAPPDVTLETFKSIAKKFETSNPELTGLQFLCDKIALQEHYSGIPGNEEQRKIWYGVLDNHLRLIADKLKDAPEDTQKRVLKELTDATTHCGGAWMDECRNIYLSLSENTSMLMENDKPENRVLTMLTDFKALTLEKLLQKMQTEMSKYEVEAGERHGHLFLMRELGPKIGLPVEEIDIQDVYEPTAWRSYPLMDKFLTLYTPQEIIPWLKDEIKVRMKPGQIADFGSLFLSWVPEHYETAARVTGEDPKAVKQRFDDEEGDEWILGLWEGNTLSLKGVELLLVATGVLRMKE